MSVAAAFLGMSADSPAGGLPAGGGVAALANIPDRQRRDGFPQPVIRREYSVIAMPVLPRRRHEIGEPEPADHAAADPLGEHGQLDVSDRAGRQERRWGVSACFGSSRPEDAVGHLRPGGARGG